MSHQLFRFRSHLWIAALFTLTAIGCTGIHKDSALEKNWGRSFEAQLYLQTANPEAGKEVKPVLDMDGAAAEQAMERYKRSFGSGQKDETVNIIKLR